MALLNVDQLSVHFGDEGTPFKAVDRISYSVKQGEVVGIVGESGSGKSVSSLAIMGLIDYPGRVMAENLLFNGQDLKRISEKERRNLVGAEVAMIFQDPMTSLNPCYTVGFQIMEAIKVHQGGNKKTRRQRAIDLLNQVGIPDPASRLDVYPHQLSGGMSQRVMIAMAIACRPKLLIADEPTTALDVTIQAQIIELLLELQQKENMALVLITHDLALVAEAAHKIIVMYAGQVVETGAAQDIFRAQRREKALAMMAKVGLKTEHYDRYPHMFSGGQRQRIAIARGLMLDPDVVIADEPVSALDVSVRAQVLNLMMDLQQDMGLSYVFISHDLSVVEHIADEVMVMYLGRCVEKGTKEQIFNNPRHPYTQALLSATPRLNPDDRRERIKLTGELPSPLNPPPGCAFNARCSRRFGPCTQLQPQLKEYDGQLVACFAVDQDENPQKPLS
ncbi:dipeptide ABC transporter ATP-binding protein [Salmonella enterica]|nr:hypothetical protein B1M01_07240 [Salmonella enterica subsp. enterica serovar Dublin]